MKHTKTPKVIAWFDQQNRRHVTFLIAVGLIGILFIIALIGILSGRYKPFADILTNNPRPKLNNRVTITAGSLSYLTPDGSTKTATGNSDTVTVQAITQGGISLQAADLARKAQINGKLTVYVDGTGVDQAVVRNLVVGSDGLKDSRHIKLKIDSDSFRDPIDAKPMGTNYTVVLKPENYLAVKKSGVQNMFDLENFATARAGDLDNNNIVDIRDFGILGPKFNQDVDPTSKFDINNDGRVNIQDFGVMGSNYNKSGEQL